MADPQIEVIPYNGPGRRPRIEKPRLILIHATRGPTSPQLQAQATINWFARVGRIEASRRRMRGWGPMSDFLVGFAGDIYQFGDYRTTRANWSAGYGSGGGQWGADEQSISIEVAQSDKLEAYSQKSIDSLVWLSRRLVAEFGILPQKVQFWNQSRSQGVPTGFLGHEDTAHGRKTGKSDPGERFPWGVFLRRVGQRPGRDSSGLSVRMAFLEDAVIGLTTTFTSHQDTFAAHRHTHPHDGLGGPTEIT